ncbi:MAG: radical SAM protein [Desulfuromonadaceae bacterium]|nr:radical SAM protein [Desulfuromonadaceae bacterium]
MNKIVPKEHHNYLAFFLTLACNLKCTYCINVHGSVSRSEQAHRNQLSTDEWVKAANRLVLRDDLPLTLQGGEPTLHKGFYEFVNGVKPDIRMDLMTNLMFNVDEFIANVPVWRFIREAPYASIRVSYHPGQNDIEDLIAKTEKLQNAGFRIGLYGIEHPDQQIRGHILAIQERCQKLGLDFRLKEFLGEHTGVMHGTFKYDGCVSGKTDRTCECRTTEIIVDPSGQIFKCHADLYSERSPIGHILDDSFSADSIDVFRPCDCYGTCNPCDVKIKTNRYQLFGHTSVEIRNIQ